MTVQGQAGSLQLTERQFSRRQDLPGWYEDHEIMSVDPVGPMAVKK